MEGITSEDIKKIYKQELEEKVKEAVASINARLLTNYKHICQKGFSYNLIDSIVEFTNIQELQDIIKYLEEIYKDWDITISDQNLCFRLITPIEIPELNLNRKECKPVTPDEVINNRAEILDLGGK